MSLTRRLLRWSVPGLVTATLAAAAGGAVLQAQSPAATLSGRITDPSGAIVVGVELEARQHEGGAVLTVKTDTAGRYEFLRLPAGHYDLTASYGGFATSERKALWLNAGDAVLLDLVLELAQEAQSITVRGEPAPLDLSSAHLRQLVNEVSVTALPINGRSVEQLALLVPGMVPVRALDRRSVNGFTTKISSNGARGGSNLFLLDGTDTQHAIMGTTPGGVSGLSLGMESIQEFEILNDAYPASVGKSAGAVINIVTRRGTPEFHGSVFEYVRDHALDARNFFDDEKPPFSRHQFGGSLGGPLPWQGSTFFGSYEGLRERLGLTLFNTVPDLDARRGILPGRTVGVETAIQPILDLYPLPNGPGFGDGTAAYSYQTVQPTDDHHANLRTDFDLGARDVAFVRYAFQNSEKATPLDTSIEGFGGDLSARNQYVTFEETRIFSPRLLHTLQFGFNRSKYQSISTADARLQSVPPLIPGRPNFGRINIRGLSSFGTDTGDLSFVMNQYELSDAIQWSTDRHDVRAGFSWKHYRSDGWYSAFFDGLMIYENLESFLTNRPQRFQGAEVGSDPYRSYRQELFALYAQDQFRWRPDVTLSYGVRYQWFTVPTEAAGRLSNLRDLMDPAPVVGEPLFENPSLLNFAPRVGLAWDVGARNRSVLRTGFGIFHEAILENIYGYSARIQTPFIVIRTTQRPPYPDPLSAPVKGNPRQDPIEFDLSTPYSMRYHLTLQQALTEQTTLTVGYAGARGVHLPRVGDINTAAPISTDGEGRPYYGPTPGRRRNPAYDAVRFTSTDGNAFYNSLQVGLNRRWHSGHQLQLSYTYGRSVDDASGYRREFTNSIADVPPDYYLRTLDRGLSNFHIGHHAVFSYAWDLPFRLDGPAWAAALVNNWQTAGIVTLSSGYPFTLNASFDIGNNQVREGHRPDLVPGASNNPILGGPDRYFDVSAFQLQTPGYLGTLGRNTVISPGYASVDVTATRTITLGGTRQAQFRLEVFNLLNRANFAAPQNSGTGGVILFNAPDGVPVGNAATIFSTVGPSRQLQLAFRLSF
jgi:hypothetical protein